MQARFVFLRHFLAVLIVCSSSLSYAVAAESTAQEFSSRISKLESERGGRIGVSVMSTNGVSLYSYRPNERFAMCSTFKALLGAMLLSRIDAGQESSDRKISYTASDILDYAPITKKHLHAGHMTVAELNAASIQYSDNTAANLLLDSAGGPAALTKYLRSIGDKVTRLDRNEPSLNTNLPNDSRDTSTPVAMSRSLQKLLLGNSLSPASRKQLESLLIGNTTGDSKLRAGFDKDWVVADKTGSGENGASNDVAIVYPKGLPPFIITVFYSGSSASAVEKNAVLAKVARITGESWSGNRRKTKQAR